MYLVDIVLYRAGKFVIPQQHYVREWWCINVAAKHTNIVSLSLGADLLKGTKRT